MFSIFKRRKVTRDDVRSSKLSLRIVAFILKIQLRWAGWMSQVFCQLTFQKQRIVLIGFIAIAGGYSVWMIVGGFVTKPSALVSVTPIQQPKYVTSPGDANGVPTGLSDKEVAMIRSFKRYMDSLSASAQGRVQLDSIKRKRPGLLDSVERISVLYKIK